MKLYSSSFYRLDDTFEHQNIHNLLKGKKLGANGLHFIKADSVFLPFVVKLTGFGTTSRGGG
jgi:hypothetical protein